METLKLAIPSIYNFTATSVTILSRPIVQCSYGMPYKIQTKLQKLSVITKQTLKILFFHNQAHIHRFQTSLNIFEFIKGCPKMPLLKTISCPIHQKKKKNSPNNNNSLKTGWSGFWKRGCSLSKMKGVGMGFKRNLLQGQWTTYWRTVSTHWRATLNCRA